MIMFIRIYNLLSPVLLRPRPRPNRLQLNHRLVNTGQSQGEGLFFQLFHNFFRNFLFISVLQEAYNVSHSYTLSWQILFTPFFFFYSYDYSLISVSLLPIILSFPLSSVLILYSTLQNNRTNIVWIDYYCNRYARVRVTSFEAIHFIRFQIFR